MTKITNKEMMKGAALAANTEQGNKMDWTTVNNVDFAEFYKLRLIKKAQKMSKGVEKDLYTVVIEGDEFEKAIFANVWDNGTEATGLRFTINNISAKNYKGDWTDVLVFNKEFKKFVNGVFYGEYPNAALEGFDRNVKYRNGASLDVNELVQGMDFFGVNKLNEAGTWNVCGSVYVDLRLGRLKKLAVLDSVNSMLPFMSVCDHAIDSTVAFKERKYNVVLSKAVKNSILGQLVANGEINLFAGKTGANYVEFVQSELTGIVAKAIENAGAKKEDIVTGEEVLEAMTVKQLREVAKRQDVKIGAKAKKAEIIAALEGKEVVKKEETVEDCEMTDMLNGNSNTEEVNPLLALQ